MEAMAFWTWMFTLSKILELGDTVFIVLRKQKLIFLHWWAEDNSIANEKSTFNVRYHHLTVLISVFANFSESYSRWSTVINFLVHSIMYTYYTLKALRLFLILCKPFPAFFVVPWKLVLCQGTFTRTTSACYHHFSSNFCPSFQQKTFRINNIY